MDESETKICPNCKREIPAVNFTIHSVHCARNIRVCPVCKEPVPVADLAEHHETMHKLLPCKKCGERVCGTDLEDHIRDSCAHTIQICKFCELELPRRDLPSHENYCGVRTEQCPECREWVMIKYRQLHLDSNHGFLRLDDDPAPPKKDAAKSTRSPKLSNIPTASTSARYFSSHQPTSSSTNSSSASNGILDGPSTSNGLSSNASVRNKNTNTHSEEKRKEALDEQDEARLIWRQRAILEEANKIGHKLPKRTNDQPQININTSDSSMNSLKKMFHKKRPAPPPPQLTPEHRRDQPYYSAMRRQQDEEKDRREQTAYNLARGLPPVLNPLEKLEKLRKMDRLQHGDEPGPSNSRNNRGVNNEANERWNREEIRNLRPMSPEQFQRRLNALRLGSDASGNERGANGASSRVNRNERGSNGADSRASRNARGANGNERANGRGDRRSHGDRFSEIKSSLRELRRGLNEVTAPYNMNAGDK
ncbi:unnamed protein product [Diatraea saccharalis]|uniref:TRAF-type domain-containing protein n=1 Tax=Diatraea saccharalis TaxID=40085 RepID=A0A9P0G3D1_9NEOP|nr:unnamed protein product [Diatraea saccharalis]